MMAEATNGDLRVGVFVCDCGLNIAGTVDCVAVTEYALGLPDVVCAVQNKYTCADPGQNEIKDAIHQHRLNRVVVASCTPRQHEPTFRQCVLDAGLNPYLMEMANLREHCSWVHTGDKEGARFEYSALRPSMPVGIETSSCSRTAKSKPSRATSGTSRSRSARRPATWTTPCATPAGSARRCAR